MMFKKKMARIETLLDASMLGKRFRQRCFDNFNPSAGTKEAYDIALDYVARNENYAPQGKGLTFIGGIGTGKTHLAGAILRELIHRKHVPGALVCVPNLLDIFRLSYDHPTEFSEKGRERKGSSANRIGSPVEVMKIVSEIDILVLDDLGSEKSNSWVIERLTMLINDRYEKMLPTIVTTNLELSFLENQVGERIVSRLVEMNYTVFMEGEDYRKKEKHTPVKKMVGEALDRFSQGKEEQKNLGCSKLSTT